MDSRSVFFVSIPSLRRMKRRKRHRFPKEDIHNGKD